MTDFVSITPGSGANIVTDTLPDGRRAQAVKLMTGADGVDGGVVTPANPLPTDTGPLEWLLRRISDLLMSPRGYDASANRMRQTAVVETGSLSAVGTVTTVTTVTALSGLGSLPAEGLARHQNIAAWASVARARIT